MIKRKVFTVIIPQTKTNNRNLEFIEKDSSVAIIKIRGFSNGNYTKFYKETFSKIDSLPIKNTNSRLKK